ncbi:hypothetical protein GCM10009557_41330 [Virgisporangium ochraceum]
MRAGAVGIALMVVLAGCATSSEARWIGSTGPAGSTGSAGSAGSTGPSAPAGADGLAAENGNDVSACFDGTCEIAVTGSVAVPLDPRFGLPALEVTFTPPQRVELRNEDPQGYLRSTVTGSSGTVQMNGIRAAVRTVRDKGAVLRFTPVR